MPSIKPVQDLKNKPGYLTTEFGLTALLIIGAFMLVLFDKITVQQITDLWPAFASVATYSVARGITKR